MKILNVGIRGIGIIGQIKRQLMCRKKKVEWDRRVQTEYDGESC